MNTNRDNTTDFAHAAPNRLSGVFDGQNYLASSPSWLQNIAFLCLCVYIYAWYLFNDFAGIFSGSLILIGIYLYWKKRYSPPAWKDPIILLFFAAILIQLFSWYLATQSHPDWSSSSPKPHRMGIWFKMIPIAIVLGGRTDRIILCWSLALAALFSASFVNGGGINEWVTGLSGKRVNFGINNAQHPAMLSGVLFLSLLAALSTNLGFAPLKRFWFYISLVVLLCITSTIVIFTQTRAAWLGLIIAVPLLLLFMLFISKQSFWSKIIKGIAGLLLIAIFLVAFQDVFKQRVGSLAQTFESVEAINQELMKTNSFTLRLLPWRESLEWINERPFFGWGGDIEKHIVTAAAKKAKKTLPFGHLHNSYLETLVNYGITGLMVLLLLCIYLAFCAHKSWRSSVMPTPIYLFLIGFLPFWVIINIAESYFYYSTGEYILAIVGGIILSYYWRHTAEKR